MTLFDWYIVFSVVGAPALFLALAACCVIIVWQERSADRKDELISQQKRALAATPTVLARGCAELGCSRLLTTDSEPVEAGEPR